jgi:DNA-binding XRE family transcriptional regulator
MQLKLNENIKKYRKSMNLTQEELAEAFGVTVGAVSKWESACEISGKFSDPYKLRGYISRCFLGKRSVSKQKDLRSDR